MRLSFSDGKWAITWGAVCDDGITGGDEGGDAVGTGAIDEDVFGRAGGTRFADRAAARSFKSGFDRSDVVVTTGGGILSTIDCGSSSFLASP